MSFKRYDTKTGEELVIVNVLMPISMKQALHVAAIKNRETASVVIRQAAQNYIKKNEQVPA
jgi:hypothetical protein